MNNRINNVPGSRGFLIRSGMFAVPGETLRAGERLAGAVSEKIKTGVLKPGQHFPDAERMAEVTGESRTTCLDALTELLRRGLLRQTSEGHLFVNEEARTFR